MCTSQKISKMKKYIITSADGKRRLTQTTYTSVGVTDTVACDTLCLNRICFQSEKRAKQFGEQFIDLFNQVLLK